MTVSWRASSETGPRPRPVPRPARHHRARPRPAPGVLASWAGSAAAGRRLRHRTTGSSRSRAPGTTSTPTDPVARRAAAVNATVADGEIPEETAGPYPGDGSNGPDVLTERRGAQRHHHQLRSASGVAEGVPLTIRLKVYDLNGRRRDALTARRSTCGTATARATTRCTPRRSPTRTTCAASRRPTTTAGWSSPRISRPAYAGRWPHIHFEVYPSLADATSASNKLRTSQLAFPKDVCQEVYATDGYEQSVTNLAQDLAGHRHGLLRRVLAAAGQDDRLGRGRATSPPQRAGLSRRWEARSVPSALPDGEPAPADGALPARRWPSWRPSARGLRARAVLPGALRLLRLQHLHRRRSSAAARRGRRTPRPRSREIELRPAVLPGAPPVETVFFGGGTPTLLPPRGPGRDPGGDRRRFGLAADAEVTTEANPDSVTAGASAELRDGGFNRVSFGMQSAVPSGAGRARPHARPRPGAAGGRLGARGGLRAGQPGPDLRHAGGVARRLADLGRRGAGLRAGPRLGVLADRGGRHRAGPAGALRRAADAGRGRPGRQVRCSPTSCSPRPGWSWYEVSNWARDDGARCRHNELYWTGADWWGVGPGAHSHVGGVRWWNVKHPSAYADRLAAGESPGAGPRAARRGDPAGRAGAAGGPPARRAVAGRGLRRPSGRRERPGSPTASALLEDATAGAHPPRAAARGRRACATCSTAGGRRAQWPRSRSRSAPRPGRAAPARGRRTSSPWPGCASRRGRCRPGRGAASRSSGRRPSSTRCSRGIVGHASTPSRSGFTACPDVDERVADDQHVLADR